MLRCMLAAALPCNLTKQDFDCSQVGCSAQLSRGRRHHRRRPGSAAGGKGKGIRGVVIALAGGSFYQGGGGC